MFDRNVLDNYSHIQRRAIVMVHIVHTNVVYKILTKLENYLLVE